MAYINLYKQHRYEKTPFLALQKYENKELVHFILLGLLSTTKAASFSKRVQFLLYVFIC